MLKIKFTPLFILLIPYIFFSQNSLSGTIENQDKVPVAFANVILLSAEDSTSVYKGTISEENGDFLIENVKDSTYLLKVSFVGYAESLRRVKVKGNTSIKTIVLEQASDALDEVVVSARKPKITRKIDRLVFEVENTSLSTGNTFDILKNTPGVIISQGELLVKNRPATIYINDRKVYLTSQELQQLLEGFSGGNVKSVEVITNPPARYDAEGGAILNITTSKNISIGYKGSANASNTIAIVPKYTIGTSQYYKNDWLNVYASYNYNERDDYKKDESFIEYYRPNSEVDSRWFTDFERDTETSSHNLNAILDFTLSDKSSLSISANALITPKSDSDINGLTEIYNPSNSLDSLFTTNSKLRTDTNNILLSASYNTTLGENTSLSAIANYINYNNEQTQDLMTRYEAPDGSLLNENSFFTIADQQSDIYTGQIDISTPLGTTSFETGLKYSGLRSESGQDFFDTNSGNRDFAGTLSDDLDYKEDIVAAYASISRDWEKISMKAGLRGEYTDVQGISENLGNVNSQNYFELFPTFYFIYTLNDDHSIGVDYSRRITRPRFQSLNTYRYFINENNFQVGNPNLKPAISNKINFNYTYKNKLSFDLYWDRANNAIATLPFQDNFNRNLRSASINMDYDQQFSFDISYYDYLKDWWYISAYSSFFYMENSFPALESAAQTASNDVFSTYIQAYNYFFLSKDRTFTGELTGTFLPDYIAGSYKFEDPQYGLSLGFTKTFFNSRLVTTLNVDDVFNSMNIPLGSNYLNQNNSFFAMPESRMLRLGVTYKFGNFKLNDNKRSIDAEESERLKEQNVLD